MGPRLDWGDLIYDQPNNESFTQKTERIQYNDVLTITGAIKGTSQNKLYCEIVLNLWIIGIGLRSHVLSLKLKPVIYQNICLTLFIVCIGVFMPSPLLNLQTVQAPLFRQPFPYILVFRTPSPVKFRFFSESPY